MELGITGKRIVVTGGSSGIGRATVDRLLREGASVMSVAHFDGVEPVGAETILPVDLNLPEAEEIIAEAIASTWGGCDGLAAIAGVMRIRDGLLATTDEEWASTWNTNVLGTVRAMRATVPSMLKAGSGSIVLMSSVRAALPDFKQPDYSLTKVAIRSLAKMASNEYTAAGIRVNSVSPGAIRTEAWDSVGGIGDSLAERHGMSRDEAIAHEIGTVRGVPAARLGTAQEIADLVAFLLSPLSGYTTGADFRADGGHVQTV